LRRALALVDQTWQQHTSTLFPNAA